MCARVRECVPAYRRCLRMGEPCVSVCTGEYACVRVNTCACLGACGTPKHASQGPCAPLCRGNDHVCALASAQKSNK